MTDSNELAWPNSLIIVNECRIRLQSLGIMTVSVEAGPPCIQSPCILIEVDFYSEKISPLVSPVLRDTCSHINIYYNLITISICHHYFK